MTLRYAGATPPAFRRQSEVVMRLFAVVCVALIALVASSAPRVSTVVAAGGSTLLACCTPHSFLL